MVNYTSPWSPAFAPRSVGVVLQSSVQWATDRTCRLSDVAPFFGFSTLVSWVSDLVFWSPKMFQRSMSFWRWVTQILSFDHQKCFNVLRLFGVVRLGGSFIFVEHQPSQHILIEKSSTCRWRRPFLLRFCFVPAHWTSNFLDFLFLIISSLHIQIKTFLHRLLHVERTKARILVSLALFVFLFFKFQNFHVFPLLNLLIQPSNAEV